MISKRTGAEIILNRQYIKDLSFENPKAPEIYTYQNIQPKLDVSIDINATKLQNEIFEVENVINVTAKKDDETLFIMELVYAGIFTIKNVSEELIQENLFIDCPTMIFPFERRIMADISIDADLPPLLLDIIDFEQMYESKKHMLNADKNKDIN